MNRVGTYFNYAQQIWDFWNMHNDAMGGLPIPYSDRAHKFHGKSVTACGPGGGPAVSNQAWPNCGQFVIGPPWVANDNLPTWVWGRYVQRVNQFSPNSVYQTGYKLEAIPGTYGRQGYQALPMARNPNLGLSPGQTPRAGYPTLPAPVPRGLSPHQPNVPGLRESANTSGQIGSWTYQRSLRRPSPRPGPRPMSPHRPTPPRPGEKEKKAKVPKIVMDALRVAHGVTETKDAIDAIFEALPKAIRDKVPKTGRTLPGARVGAGKPYLSTYDKAKALYQHWDKIDLPTAIRELLKNHFTDEVIGRMFGGADAFSKKNLGGSRLVFT